MRAAINVKAECEKSGQSGNALLLLLLIKSWPDAEGPTREELAALVRVTYRQAERHLKKLVEVGLVTTNRARGRGQTTRYHPAENRTFMSDKAQAGTSDLTAEANMTSASDKAENTPSDPGLSDTNVRLTEDKSDTDVIETAGKSDIYDQPPRTPHKDITNSKLRSGANAPPPGRGRVRTERASAEPVVNAEGLNVQQYVGRLLGFRLKDLGVKSLPRQPAEAAAAKRLCEAGYETVEVAACYHALKRQKWRQNAVTLATVEEQIAAWKKGQLSDEREGQPRRQQPHGDSTGPRTAILQSRDYSVFARPAGGGGTGSTD